MATSNELNILNLVTKSIKNLQIVTSNKIANVKSLSFGFSTVNLWMVIPRHTVRATNEVAKYTHSNVEKVLKARIYQKIWKNIKSFSDYELQKDTLYNYSYMYLLSSPPKNSV